MTGPLPALVGELPFAGEQPEGVDDTDWLIATAFAHPDQGGEGLTLSQVSARVGLSMSGVSGRVSRMRNRGWEIRAARKAWMGPEAAAKGRAVAHIQARAKFAVLRDEVLDRMGRISDSSGQIVEMWLDDLLQHPEKILQLETLEILRVARIAEMAVGRAEKLRVGDTSGGWAGPESDDLGGGEYQTVIESMEVAVRAFRSVQIS